ncbi:calcium-binding protein [Massilia sp. KIM]|uniref:calcium-binding protein n=1 Tax=Massilia sp. KIM TaxID=1955422 RepID=UPI0015C38CB4|nr:calcium-binding protein [Massilia sp. KIM]
MQASAQQESPFQTIVKTYVEYLGRPVDASNLSRWLGIFEEYGEELSIGMLRYELSVSREFPYPYFDRTNPDNIDRIYQTLFERTPDAETVAGWIARLNADPLMGLGNVVRELSDGAAGDDATVLASKIAAAEAFVGALDTPAEMKAYAGYAGLRLGTEFLTGIKGPGSLELALGTLDATMEELLQLPPDRPAQVQMSIAGTPTLGATLHATYRSTDPDGVSFQEVRWLANGAPIPWAYEDTLEISSLLAGMDIALRVTITDARGFTTVHVSETVKSGNDRFDGTPGEDFFLGGEGDDLYRVNRAGDLIVEKENQGTDQVDVAFTAAGTYTLSPHVENATVVSAGTLAVNLVGNAQDNRLTGNAGANTLTGGAGNDALDGKGGKDTLVGGAGDDVYIVDAADLVVEGVDGGVDRIDTALTSYTLGSNLENLRYTGSQSFTGNGNAGANEIAGGDGGARLAGNAGKDVLRGGKGSDKLDGGADDDTLYGAGGNDSLLGGTGDDALHAGGGADLLDGGAGEDSAYLSGAFGDYERSRPNATDTLLVHKLTKDAITLRNVEHVVFADGSRSLAEVQLSLPSAGDDVLVGTDGADLLDGGLGADAMLGGLGNDRYVVDVAGDLVTELADGGTDRVEVAFRVAGSYTLADHVEHASVTASAKIAVNLFGNGLDNTLVGNAAANLLQGGAGNDILDGGAGKDKLVGGTGDDTYVVDLASDVVVEAAGEGADLVRTNLGSYKLGDHLESLHYTGAKGFVGTGNAQANVIVGGAGADKLSGADGGDFLDGHGGNDVLEGGNGDDKLVVGKGASKVDGGAGQDTLMLAGEFGDYVRSRPSLEETVLVNKVLGIQISVRNVEQFVTSEGEITLAELQDNLATAGNDELDGTDGDDLLDGGAGADTLRGGLGDDRYVINVGNDKVVEREGEGRDTVALAFTAKGAFTLAEHLEEAVVVAAAGIAVDVSGNALDNRLIGHAGANMIAGGDGADRLTGGAGKDVFVLDSAIGVDTVTDFVTRTDKLRVLQDAFRIGDGDAVVEGAVLRTGPGGFAASAELVILTTKLSGELTAETVATAIGSAQSAYTAGAQTLFVVGDGKDSAVFLFTSNGADSLVAADELQMVVELLGTPSVAVGDFAFG